MNEVVKLRNCEVVICEVVICEVVICEVVNLLSCEVAKFSHIDFENTCFSTKKMIFMVILWLHSEDIDRIRASEISQRVGTGECIL